jgi:phosphoglucosamine mutase
MSNMALELALEAAQVPFVRAKVGDRYVLQALEENNWVIGGEPSGHILTLDKSTTGDAIIAALQVLTVMVEQKKHCMNWSLTLNYFHKSWSMFV